MEFPDLGDHCQQEGCNRMDFLSLQCKCGKVMCRFHFLEHCQSSECMLAPKPREINLKNEDLIFKCSQKKCRKGSLHKMLCGKCKKHYCIEHRFHPSCPEIDDETMAAKREQFEAPRRQFAQANLQIQEKITENIRKALQSSTKVKTASKIHLMRIKQKAVGPRSVPALERVYFAIGKPKNMDPKPVKIIDDMSQLVRIETVMLDPELRGSLGVFVSSKWSLGRAIDSICDSCKITNNNNKMGKVKLRLFRQLDGYCISPLKVDVEIRDLMKQEVLIEGDKLIIEYIDTEILAKLDPNAQVFLS